MKFTSVLYVLVLLLAALPAAHTAQSEPAPTFPFVMPAFDSAPTPVDMSFLSPEPAGAHGFVRVQGGHFVDGAGKRVRFLGTNFTFAASFPPKDAAPGVAARLRKLGINIVRFHHMDNQAAPRGIWQTGLKQLDPDQLDRLDWMIYQLKEHGIYANLNLHVSRNYPGLSADAGHAFNYGKVLDNFHRPFIDLQKEYARALLTHVNRYTGKSYAEEPAVAVVEINNENTLLGAAWPTLRAMPEPFLSDLTGQWRHWLRARYTTTAALAKGWGAQTEPAGPEVLKNGDFAAGMEGWNFQHSPEALGTAEPAAEGPAPGRPALRLRTTKAGPLSWEFQLIRPGLELKEGAIYTLSFQGRAEPAQQIAVDVRLDQAPWTMCGLSDTAALTKEWHSFSYTFRARGTVPKHGRVTLGLKNQVGDFWLAGVSLRPGGTVGLPPGQSLEAGNIPLPPSNATPGEERDFWQFLAETERAYVSEMRDFLKKDLHVQANVVDTQASYGGIGGVFREGTLSDFVDTHAYWQHPRFPGRPWDGANWNIANTPMSADPAGGTLFRLAMQRVQGKPFTVSEYDHPAPSCYSAEMFPMAASFAAYQDWDGLYQFDYGNTASDDGKIAGYFSMCCNPAKLAFLPIAALMLRGGEVRPGGAPAVLDLPAGQVVTELLDHGGAWGSVEGAWQAAGADPSLPLRRPVAVRIEKGGRQVRLTGAPKKPAGPPTSQTGEIAWEPSPAEKALYTVNAPAVRVATGMLGGRTVSLGDVTFTVPAFPGGWAAVALAALDQQPLAVSKRMLLVAMGRAENTGMIWNEEHNSVSWHWGQAPTRAEGIALRVTLPGGVKECRALDGTGAPGAEVPVAGGSITVGPERQTVWYLLTR